MNETTEKARYFSKLTSLRIVMRPAYTKELDGRIVSYPGKTISFQNNYYETADKDEIAYLDGNDMADRVYWKLSIDDKLNDVRRAKMEDLEAREKRLALKEKEIADREARVSVGVHANPDEQADVEKRREELLKLTRDQLTAELDARELPRSFNNKEQAVERILESEKTPVQDNASSEGDGAMY